MELIAAIDLRGGRAVRLQQGDYRRQIPGAHDPVGLAARWAAAGIRRLHLVDLEGARAGEPRQLALISAIARAAREMAPNLVVQAGGGLRDGKAVAALLEAGVDAAILGTAAVERLAFVRDCAASWPGQILVSLDLRDGRPVLDGWRREARGDPIEIGRRLLADGAAGLLITDAQRDGTLGGPNLGLLYAFRRALPDAWLAGAGGVSSEGDLLALQEAGLDAAVVGLALLTGAVRVPETLAALDDARGAVRR